MSRNLNQNGNAMIVVIIGLVLLSGTCIELMTGGISQIPNLIKSYRATASRDSLELSLMNRASFPGIYRSSLHPDVIAGGENEELLVCVVGVPGKLCMANTIYPIALYSWETDSKTLATSLIKIAGPSPNLVASAQHVSYDQKGNICPSTGASADCAFLTVESSFKATCPAGAVSCAFAENFQIFYSITGSSAEKNMMATKDRVASFVNINKILPPRVGTVGTFTQVSGITGDPSVTTNISGTLATITSAGLTNTTDAANLANLLVTMGVTDQKMIYAIALSAWRDQTNIQKFMEILTQKNITDPISMNALAYRSGLDPVLYAGIANAISKAGITDQLIANQISRFHVTDPVLAAAYAIPKTQAILDLITTSVSWLDPGYVNALASSFYVAGITTASGGSILAIAKGGLLDPVKIPLVFTAIAGSGTTNQTYINTLGQNRITDTSVAIQAVNTLTAIGATDQRIANTIVAGRMFDVATAQNFYSTIGALGSTVNSYNYLNTGLTSLTTFNNFVSATAAANMGNDYSRLHNIADLIKANNLTTLAEMQALITATYPSASTATPAIAANTVVDPSVVTVTPTPTAPVNGTPSDIQVITNLNTLSGTCTVDCTASSF